MKAQVIALDFETSRKGDPSVEFYKPDFTADSVAIAWREDGEIKTYSCSGEANIKRLLDRIKSLKVPVAAHNVQFEYGVTKFRFPGHEGLFKYDTMRLLQVADNGNGDPSGFGLQAGVARWLHPKHHNHKEPYYSLIRERGDLRKGKEGANLHLLTKEELDAYNTSDAIVTLLLYEVLTEHFKELDYDWTIDHDLFFSNLPHYTVGSGYGVPVDRERASEAILHLDRQRDNLEKEFTERNHASIRIVEQRLRDEKLGRYRTEKGRLKASLDDCKFNIGSTKHLKMLFCDVMGITPQYTTEKGAPLFRRQFLGQFGDSGKMLAKRRGLIVEAQQTKAILEESGEDGRWRPQIKMCGTATGRGAGGRYG